MSGDLRKKLEEMIAGLDNGELAGLLQGAPSGKKGGLSAEEIAMLLSRRMEELQKEHQFRPGQLVRWKRGLHNKKLPEVGEPAIVLQVLDEPVLDATKDCGSTYFREPLNIVLGVLDPDGDFITFHYDGRRFEPYD